MYHSRSSTKFPSPTKVNAKTHRQAPLAVAAIALIGFHASSVRAVELFWDADGDLTPDLGGFGLWSEIVPTWREGSATGPLVSWVNAGANNDALLQGIPGTLDLAQDIVVNDIRVAPSTPGLYTIQIGANRLSLAGARPSVIEIAADSTLTIASSANQFIFAEAGFTKSGPGTLTFTSGYNLTGPIQVSGGTMVTGVSTLRGNPVTIASGATIQRSDAAITLGTLSGSGTLSTGTGTILQIL